jgi:tetratricopeptide (TPR) repeat protein
MPGENGKPGGVVLSNGTFLGPDEFRNMRKVPELVFVNCCHLASGDADQLLNYDRASFASGVAGALIEIGVRCVVAAGWAVDDEAASRFAEAFYGSLLRMERFIDAVDKGRQAAYESKNVNTWAAYQAYGDPDWVLRRKAQDVNQATAPSVEDFSGVASVVSLKLALERITVQTKFQGADPATQLNSLKRLEDLVAGKEKWGKQGAVAELFGEAFVEAGNIESGIQWYEKAVRAPDGKASMKAAEQLANVRGRLGWEIVDKAMRHLDEMKKREKAGGQTSKGRAAARRARADAERSLRQAVGRAGTLIEESIALLTKLIAVQQTIERASLIGSAYKRRALVNGAAGRRAPVQRALRQMKAAYEDARAVGEKSGASDLYYPASNCLAADVALNAGTRRWNLDRESIRILRKSLKAKSAADPDFWSVVGEAEIDQYEALAGRSLAAARRQLMKAYEDLHKRVTATRMWASVYDTACLVLPNYASRATGKERAAANELLAQLRTFAHPDESESNAE